MGISPSPVLHAFVSQVRDTYPKDEQAKIHAFTPRLKTATPEADHQRSHRCLIWAAQLAGKESPKHPRWAEFKELHKERRDLWLGLDVGVKPSAGMIGPETEVRIAWAQEAVDVARVVGEEVGWDKAPWTDLLEELIEMKAG